jgi:MFS superfamily sulfate permease-like transporter
MQAFGLYNLVPFSLGNIGWEALLRQVPTLLVVCVVCSLGTSMDVMAVQAETPWELISDQEITALGVGNLLAGLFAGGGPGTPPLSPLLLLTSLLVM